MSIENEIVLGKQKSIIEKVDKTVSSTIAHHTASDQAFGMLFSPMEDVPTVGESVSFEFMTKPKLI